MPLSRTLVALVAALAAARALAAEGGPGLRRLDAELALAPPRGVGSSDPAADLGPRLAMADPASATTATPGAGLDFDLLGAAAPAAPVDAAAERASRRRRAMLSWHQGIGLALVAAELGTTVVGQLNYADKFAGTAPANTDRYRGAHAALAVSTLGLFAANGLLALLTPAPPGRKLQLDRVMVHRVSMALAAAGMIAQGVTGFGTSGREGYLDQKSRARTHLVLGYATLAAFTAGVGAITF